MVVREPYADSVEKISASTSYGGNPMACAAALASILAIEEEGLLDNARRLEAYFKPRLEEMKRIIYEMLDIIRVYTKSPGSKADLNEPVILKKGSTVEEAAGSVHKDFLKNLKYAQVWGSGKFDGQRVRQGACPRGRRCNRVSYLRGLAYNLSKMSTDDARIEYAISHTEVLRPPRQTLSTFGTTNIYYYLLTEPAYKELAHDVAETVIREGRVIAERPRIVTPYYLCHVEGFSADARNILKKGTMIYTAIQLKELMIFWLMQVML
jgi:hypothetical protein